MRITIANRFYETTSNKGIDIYLFGSRPETAIEKIDGISNFDKIIKVINTLPGEYTIIWVGNKNNPQLQAYRGPTSNYDLFFTTHGTTDFIIGDHFRNVLSEIPVENRTVPSSVHVDQLLLGTRPSDPYIREISRLGHNEKLTYNGEEVDTVIKDGGWNDQLYTGEPETEQLKDHLNNLTSGSDDSVTTMLTGGIDSTLLQFFVDADTTVSGSISSPRYISENRYAGRASQLLNTNHNFLEFEECKYVELVEKATDATGHPLLHMQTPLLERVFASTDFETYFSGEFADSVFGKPYSHIYKILDRCRYIIPFIPNISDNIIQAKTMLEEIRRSATHSKSVAMNASIHTDPVVLSQIFSDTRIRRRKQKRLEYVQNRTSYTDKSGYSANIHLSHFMTLYQGNTASLWRQAAIAHGKHLRTPYSGLRSVLIALSVPPNKRYAKGLTSKWIPKTLLKELIPSYQINKEKLSSGLDVENYFTSGPLSEAFEKYQVPQFVPSTNNSIIHNANSHVSWYAFSYAVWRERILENNNLKKFDHTKIIKVG